MPQSATILKLPANENTVKVRAPQVPPRVLKAAYHYCAAITRSHYENFPVASCIIPRQFRPAVQAIYAFSRIADDFADEAEYGDSRLKRLNEWEALLADETVPSHPVFIAVHDTIKRHALPKTLFFDLLAAFKMDVTKKRYETFAEVLNYCQHSANPVGRLVLTLFGYKTVELQGLSDCICTALQLTNFWQDVAIDLKKNRIYLPEEECDKFGVPEASLFAQTYSENFRRLMQFQFERTREIFLNGKPLGLCVSGKLGVELRLTWLTGVTILKRIRDVQYNVFQQRPTLSKWDFARLFIVAANRFLYDKVTL